MKNLRIRTAAIHDTQQILKFIEALAEYEKLSDQVVATEAKLIATLFPNNGAPAAEVQLAYLDEKPVGFALYFSNYSTFLAQPGIHLEDLFVDPDERGRGIGEALFRKVAAIAFARGAGRLEWSVLDWNKPAIDFYRRLGGRPMDDWTTFRIEGAALQDLGGAS